MAFCTNCGSSVEDGMNFCGNCGTRVESKTAPIRTAETSSLQINEHSSQRKTIYDGEIHKCPHCGVPLASFVKNCPDCGYEIRSSATTSSVHTFAISYANAANNFQKIDLIRTFVIPNTKEDILEFVILAHSNIDTDAYSKDESAADGVSQQDITEAWMVKLEQAFQKANILLADDPYLEKINNLYFDKKKALDSARAKFRNKRRVRKFFGKKRNIVLLAIFVPITIILCIPLIQTGIDQRKLEKQVQQIETYIDEGNYGKALTIAYEMDGKVSDNWAKTKANLINRILELKGINENDNARPEGEAYDEKQDTEHGLIKENSTTQGTAKTSKNGFDQQTNKTYSLDNISFFVPDYYVEREKGDQFLKLATAMEDSDAFVIILNTPTKVTEQDYLDSVNLFSRNMYEQFTNPQIQSDESVIIAGIQGRKLIGTGEIDGIPVSFMIVHLFDSNNQKLIGFVFAQKEDCPLDYFPDMVKSIESLQLS